MLHETEQLPDGCCLTWYYITKEVRWRGDKDDLRNILPELWRTRTVKIVVYADPWFNGENERIAALKQCIKETSDF
jgi:hypothetical protein